MLILQDQKWLSSSVWRRPEACLTGELSCSSHSLPALSAEEEQEEIFWDLTPCAGGGVAQWAAGHHEGHGEG